MNSVANPQDKVVIDQTEVEAVLQEVASMKEFTTITSEVDTMVPKEVEDSTKVADSIKIMIEIMKKTEDHKEDHSMITMKLHNTTKRELTIDPQESSEKINSNQSQ